MRESDKHVYAHLDYNALGQLERLEHGNGVVEHIEHDGKREWTNRHTIGLEPAGKPAPPYLYEADFGHYPDAKVQWAAERDPDLLTQRYTYDLLGRLKAVEASDPERDRRYDYDAIGRITWTSTAGDYRYTDPEQAHAPTETDAGHTREYDANGNLTSLHDPMTRSPAVQSTGWDLAIQWTVGGLPETVRANPATKAAEVTQIGYDADDQRVYVAGKNGATRYFGALIEQGPDGSLTKLYWAGDRLLAKRDAKGLTTFHQDRMGSTRLTTDGSGSVLERFDYDPYGKPLAPPNRDERLWLGEQRDRSSGLVQMGWARSSPPTPSCPTSTGHSR